MPNGLMPTSTHGFSFFTALYIRSIKLVDVLPPPVVALELLAGGDGALRSSHHRETATILPVLVL